MKFFGQDILKKNPVLAISAIANFLPPRAAAHPASPSGCSPEGCGGGKRGGVPPALLPRLDLCSPGKPRPRLTAPPPPPAPNPPPPPRCRSSRASMAKGTAAWHSRRAASPAFLSFCLCARRGAARTKKRRTAGLTSMSAASMCPMSGDPRGHAACRSQSAYPSHPDTCAGLLCSGQSKRQDGHSTSVQPLAHSLTPASNSSSVNQRPSLTSPTA